MPDELDTHPPERRQLVGLTQQERDRLMNHLALEEARQKAEDEKFKLGDQRMAAIEEDLKPLKKMYWAVVGCGAVGTALFALLIWVYLEDRSGMKEMQAAILKQGSAIQSLLSSHAELERDTRRDIGRIESYVFPHPDNNGGQRRR